MHVVALTSATHVSKNADDILCPNCRRDNLEVFLDETLSIHLEDECKWTGKLGNLDHHMREVTQSGESSQ